MAWCYEHECPSFLCDGFPHNNEVEEEDATAESSETESERTTDEDGNYPDW